MRSDIKQILLFAGFGFISCIFVFWVPWGNDESISPNTSADSESSLAIDSEEINGAERDPHFSWTLKVQVDGDFPLSWLKAILSWFEEKYGGSIQLLNTSSLSRITPDLILSDNLSNTWLSLNLSNPVEEYFITGLQELIKIKNLIPFGLDPLMVYTHKKTGLTWDFGSWETQRVPKSTASGFFPFWSDKVNFWPSVILNFKSMELLISELEQTNNIGRFQDVVASMMDVDLGNKLLTFTSQQSNCRVQPITCMIEKGFLAVGFAFRSQIAKNPDLVSDFFPSSLENHYFRGFFFSIPSKSSHPDWARMFVLYYLQLQDQQLKSLIKDSNLINPFIHLLDSEDQSMMKNFQFFEEINYRPGPQKSKLLKKIVEKKIKPDLYFDSAFIY